MEDETSIDKETREKVKILAEEPIEEKVSEILEEKVNTVAAAKDYVGHLLAYRDNYLIDPEAPGSLEMKDHYTKSEFIDLMESNSFMAKDYRILEKAKEYGNHSQDSDSYTFHPSTNLLLGIESSNSLSESSQEYIYTHIEDCYLCKRNLALVRDILDFLEDHDINPTEIK